MRRLHGRFERGEIEMSFTKILFFVLLAVGGWAIMELSFAYYCSVLVEKETSGILLSHRHGFSAEEVTEEIRQKIPKLGPLAMDDKELKVMLAQDGSEATVSMPYVYQVKVPMSAKVWEIHFHPVVTEKLTGKGL